MTSNTTVSNEWKRMLWTLCLLLSFSLVQAPVRWVELVGYLLLGFATGVVGLKLWPSDVGVQK